MVLNKFVKPIVKPTAPPKDYSIHLTKNQLKLEGVWKSKILGSYISFKFYRFTWQGPAGSGEYCQEVKISTSNTICEGYTEFAMSDNSTSFSVNIEGVALFTLRDGELEMAASEKGGTTDLIYTKTTLTPPSFKGTPETLE